VSSPPGRPGVGPHGPVLLTSLASAVLADGQGDVRYARESRGAVSEWGGVYGQLIRLTGPWTISLGLGDSTIGLPSCRIDDSTFPGGWRSEHRWNNLEIRQDLVATARPAGAVRRLTVHSRSDREVSLAWTSRFSPYLFPVLVEGIRPIDFDLRSSAEGVAIRHKGFGLRVASTVPPSSLFLDGRSWVGGKYHGPVGEFASEHRLAVPPGGTAEIRWQVAGGLVRDLDAAITATGGSIGSPDELAAQLAEADRQWTQGTPDLEFPDAPELEAAYRAARTGLRRLYSAPDEGLVGLLAGYPWYSAIWCRDLAIMLPALLWLGDFEWVARSLATVFQFQCRGTVRFLGGEPGELPMQLAPGPIFLYGTSDSTLRFPAVVEQLHRHTGDLASVGEWADALHRIVEWGKGRSDPSTGLLRHGGEAEAISATTAILSRVHYGIDTPDTTIWDSADRREHALDVQVLWWETLCSAAHLLRHAGDTARREPCEELARRLAGTIRARYVWPEEHYLYDSLRGTNPVPRVRPNALRAVSADLLDPDVSRAAVDRAAADDLSTAWGVRSLSSLDPQYDPRAYHEGQVWTIATAWAADAAFAMGQRRRGLEYLRTIAQRYVAEGGFANECYLGDRPEPFNSCFLLGFSVAPFLTVLFERLWGIRLGWTEGSVRIVPAFPEGWTSANLRGLRLWRGRVDLGWTPEKLSVRWNGPHALAVDTGTGVHPVAPGETALLDLLPLTERS
jgi:glycogen debranching enzyme